MTCEAPEGFARRLDIARDRRWQANFHGLEFEPTSLVLSINALTRQYAKERHSSPTWWDRIVNLF